MADPEYARYLDGFCKDFEEKLMSLIDKTIEDRVIGQAMSDPLYQEVVQHSLFAQSKLEVFYGQEETLKVHNYYHARQRIIMTGGPRQEHSMGPAWVLNYTLQEQFKETL